MGYRARFPRALALRTLVLAFAIGLFVAALMTPDLAAARIVAGGLVVGALTLLWQHVNQTSHAIARFVDAARFGDFSQRFDTAGGAGFDVMGEALNRALVAMRMQQSALAEEARFLSAAIDDAPVALLAIADDGRVTALSKAARQLFDRTPLTHVEDFAAYGAELAAAMALPPGGRRMTRIMLDRMPQHVLVGSARLERLGHGTTIVSILKVQHERGQIELAAQADLVRVLTHEIMNSLTPVTSLARSGADLVRAAAQDDAALADASAATETVARRAEALLRFVASYRDFAVSPEVRRRAFAVDPWAQEVARLACADPRMGGLTLAVMGTSAGATIEGDPDLLAQVALNLIRNAALAGASRAELRVAMLRGGHAAIEVADDGPGIPPDRRDDVFLPFYTTRPDGSGVGLSLARQIVLAHGGSIAAGESDLGGASIRMVI